MDSLHPSETLKSLYTTATFILKLTKSREFYMCKYLANKSKFSDDKA